MASLIEIWKLPTLLSKLNRRHKWVQLVLNTANFECSCNVVRMCFWRSHDVLCSVLGRRWRVPEFLTFRHPVWQLWFWNDLLQEFDRQHTSQMSILLTTCILVSVHKNRCPIDWSVLGQGSLSFSDPFNLMQQNSTSCSILWLLDFVEIDALPLD